MTPVQPVRGTQSLLGEDADRLAAVISAFDKVRRLYGFRRVEVPTIEQTAVFARTIGETTDVVSKEMYSFEDRGGDSITLRPGIHGRNRARIFERGLAAARADQGRDPRLGFPLRASAERPLPGVPPARCRDHRRRRTAGGRRTADVRRAIAERARHREGAILQLNTLGDPETRARWRDALRRAFPRPRASLSRRQPVEARQESAADSRQQGASGLADRRRAPSDRRVPDAPKRRTSSPR